MWNEALNKWLGTELDQVPDLHLRLNLNNRLKRMYLHQKMRTMCTLLHQPLTKNLKELLMISHNAVVITSSIEEPFQSDLHPEIHLNNENKLNNVAAPTTISSTAVRMEEPPKHEEGLILGMDKSLQVIDNSVEVSLNTSFKSASGDSNTAIPESNIHSNFEFGKVGEVLSAEIEFGPTLAILMVASCQNWKLYLCEQRWWCSDFISIKQV